MMGFASNKTVADEKWIVPRSVMAANVKLCGVLLAYAPEPAAKLMKKAMGWNFAPRALGEKITREITELVLSKRVRPVIGRVVRFEEIPAAIEAMANRETVGRTIVRPREKRREAPTQRLRPGRVDRLEAKALAVPPQRARHAPALHVLPCQRPAPAASARAPTRGPDPPVLAARSCAKASETG